MDGDLTVGAPTSRTAIYRVYDERGRLLYVGISGNPMARWRTHSTSKPWWGEVAKTKVKWHSTRSSAEAAEVKAIREEFPRYNKQHARFPLPRGASCSELRAAMLHLLASPEPEILVLDYIGDRTTSTHVREVLAAAYGMSVWPAAS